MPSICKKPECTRQAYYNDANIPGAFWAKKLTPKFCGAHKTDSMINVKTKRCLDPSCQKYPSFNFPGKKSLVFCNEHKQPGMIDVKSKRCHHPSCEKIPIYNFPGKKKRIYCRTHKKKDMVDIKSNKCLDPNCQKSAHFNKPGEKIGLFCLNHIPLGERMINVIRKKCITEGCETQVTSVTSKKYGGFCHTCAVFNGLADVPKNIRVKERVVMDFLNENFSQNFTLTFDKQTACSKKRPDMFIDFGNFILVVEVDENQHKQYDSSCERRRIMEIQASFGEGTVSEDGPDKFKNVTHRPMVFIRFNPDHYRDENGKKNPSCFKLNSNSKLVISNNRAWKARLKKLKKTMKDIIAKNDGKLSNCLLYTSDAADE